MNGSTNVDVLSFDFAEKFDVATFVDETKKGFWSIKKEYDVPFLVLITNAHK